jgi:Cu-Zn family superoxide dismutase
MQYARHAMSMVAVATVCLLATPGFAAEVTVEIYTAEPEGEGPAVGTIRFSDSEFGLLVTPDLQGMTPGPHGTHVHENPSCEPMEMAGEMHAAGMAGDHYDPEGTGRHAGPYGDGHLGDLPNLIVEADGTATIPVLAPRLTVSDILGRSVMIHAEADRYDDHGSHHHGKGGPRMYCGFVPSAADE